MAIRAAAEEKLKEAQEEQGTGFDYIRERNPPTPAVPVKKKTEKAREKKKAEEKKKADEAWDDVIDYIKDPFKQVVQAVSPTKPKKKKIFNKPKIIKVLLKKNKIK